MIFASYFLKTRWVKWLHACNHITRYRVIITRLRLSIRRRAGAPSPLSNLRASAAHGFPVPPHPCPAIGAALAISPVRAVPAAAKGDGPCGARLSPAPAAAETLTPPSGASSPTPLPGPPAPGHGARCGFRSRFPGASPWGREPLSFSHGYISFLSGRENADSEAYDLRRSVRISTSWGGVHSNFGFGRAHVDMDIFINS
jgi:hypothetical protein